MARKVLYEIRFDGKEIKPISYLAINQPLNGHHTFEVRIPVNEKSKLLAQMSQTYIGKKAQLNIISGLGNQDRKFQFVGIVTGVGLAKNQGTTEEMVFTGHSVTILLDDGPHSESFSEMNLEKIAKKITGKYALPNAPKIKPRFTTNLPYFVQYRETVFQFLSRLATVYGEWFYYDGMDLWFGEPARPAEIELRFGRDLFHFDLSLNISPTKFTYLGYDPLTHKFPEVHTGSQKISGLDDYGNIAAGASEQCFTNEPLDMEYYEVREKSDLEELSKHKKSSLTGKFVQFIGSSDQCLLMPGSVIKVTGTIGGGAAQQTVEYGKFRIIQVSHTTDELGNYRNSFKAISESLTEPPVNPLVSNPTCEAQPAEVLDNHDPDKLGRVRVQFQWQKAANANEKTPWIRVSASGAGGAHGAYFVPEKNDQVFVAFENNNPNRPYVIGSLYHGKSKPGGGLSNADNNKKVIKTKSGNQILLDDEGGKQTILIESGPNSIKLTLDGGAKIVITTSENLELNGKNITLAASENITLKATKDITVVADQNGIIGGKASLALSSDAKSQLKGAEIQVTGQGKTTVEGGAAVEVKGGVIKLN